MEKLSLNEGLNVGTASDDPIYLDYNATTPIDADVAKHMLPFLTTRFGNPSSSHIYGKRAAAAIAEARGQVAGLIQAAAEEIVFMSGGTETINYVLKGAASLNPSKRKHIVTSVVEHVAVLETCRYLESCGVEVTYVPVNKDGFVDANAVADAVRSETVVVSIMHSNNETGAFQPIKEIVRLVKNKNGFLGDCVHALSNELPTDSSTLVHTDASQSLGKVEVSVKDLGVDFLTIAGHKLYAPKGIGALYLRKGCPILPKLIHGASHENGIRAGTESVPLAVALGKACEIAAKNFEETEHRLRELRDKLYHEIKSNCKVPFKVNTPLHALPNTLSISFQKLLAIDLLSNLEPVLAASAGSACHSSTDSSADHHISYVLQAMGVEKDYALGTLRLSVGRFTSDADILRAAKAISNTANDLFKKKEKEGSHLSESSVKALEPTDRLYFEDTYRYSCEATVVCVYKAPPSLKGGKQGTSEEDSNASPLLVVVTNQTVFHPQGGGQPADIGKITSDDGSVFNVEDVRSDKITNVIEHFGRFSNDDGPEFSPGTSVSMTIDPQRRLLNARLHSAGHALDRAMHELGYRLKPLKGYHFLDGPFVEYEGKLSAAEKEKLPERLNDTIKRIIGRAIPTKMTNLSAVESAEYYNSAQAQEEQPRLDLSGFPSDVPVRVVTVAQFPCPCGGTHVKNTEELGEVIVHQVKGKGNKLKVYYTIS